MEYIISVIKEGGNLMKKILVAIVTILCALAIFLIIYFGREDRNDELTTIRVAEVAHSVFYAPKYVAINNGYFEDEGIRIESILTPGADRVTAAVLSGDVDIGFCGPEASIYIYKQGEVDYIQTFAGLTIRDGSFIVGREPNPDFTLDDLKGKHIIGGRKGGMPNMTLQWTIRQAGIHPTEDMIMDTSIDFAAMSGAFISGIGDYVTLFEPTATNLENEGLGYVLASVGKLGGEMPYVGYNARKSFIEENEDLLQRFTNAIQRGLDFVNNNESREIAEAIARSFPDASINDLIMFIDRYKEAQVWGENTYISEETFNHLQNVMIYAGELDEKVPYENLIFTRFMSDN